MGKRLSACSWMNVPRSTPRKYLSSDDPLQCPCVSRGGAGAGGGTGGFEDFLARAPALDCRLDHLDGASTSAASDSLSCAGFGAAHLPQYTAAFGLLKLHQLFGQRHLPIVDTGWLP